MSNVITMNVTGLLLVESIYCQSQITLANGTGNAIRTISKTVRKHTAMLVYLDNCIPSGKYKGTPKTK